MNLILILISVLVYISKILCEDACLRKECITQCGKVGYVYNKCQTCHCNIREDCPPVRCRIDCPFGRKKDKQGCEYCHCEDPCIDGKNKLKCQAGYYCFASHEPEGASLSIRTRCLQFGDKSFHEYTTTIITRVEPPNDASDGPFKPETHRPGSQGPRGTEGSKPSFVPPPAPAPPTHSSDCECSGRGCKCRTAKTHFRSTFKDDRTTEQEIGYKSTDVDEISTQKNPIPMKKQTHEPLHIPTLVYAILASILGASIIGIVVIVIILYRRKCPKDIDSQEEELTKEQESVSSTEVDCHKNLNSATKV